MIDFYFGMSQFHQKKGFWALLPTAANSGSAWLVNLYRQMFKKTILLLDC